MSRSTQYIGLNKYAREYVKNAVAVEMYDMTTGMFDEIIKGNIYHMVSEDDNSNLDDIFIEIVQDEPWSSGPMIFTCLKRKLIKKSGQEVDMGDYFRWMLDPSIEYEVDYETGRYYV